MQIELTEDEKKFLLNLLKSLNINALEKDAQSALTMIISLAEKLSKSE